MKKIFTIGLLCLFLTASGQPNLGVQTNLQNANKTLPTITRPSPTVSQLMKVEESQLDNYTGQPDITIPLFSNPVKNLNVGLALSYNSSGIRVNEQSGWVGKGWSLSTGGVISRTVVDLPDEINVDKFKGANYNIYHDFFDYAENGLERRRFAYDTQWGTQADVDSKNDTYQFNFFGKTGRFVFTRDGTILKPVIIGDDNNYKIAVNYIVNSPPGYYPTEIASFVITDDSGYRYYFSEIERTEKKDVNFVYLQPECNAPVAPSPDVNIGKFISAWHLVKVVDENGVKLIDITYHSVLEKPMVQISTTTYNARDKHQITTSNYPMCNDGLMCALKPERIVNTPFRNIDSKKVNRITFMDKSYIQFFISSSHPEYRDQTGAYLQSIGIYNGQDATAVKTFNFTYYSGGLFLQDVKTNNSAIDKHTFEYSNRVLHPGFGSLDIDVFGYPNFFPFNESTSTGVLTKITYPTKGTREFTWEPNTYSYRGDKLLSFSEIFTNPDNYMYDDVNNSLSDPEINNSGPVLSQIIYITIEQDALVSAGTYANGPIAIQPEQLNITPIFSTENQATDPSRPELGFSIQTNQSVDVTRHFKPGYYKLSFFSYNHSLDHVKVSAGVTVHIKRPKSKLNWFLYGGGIRINGIRDKDNGADQIVKGYKYNLENPGIVPADLPPLIVSPNLPLSQSLFFSSGSLDGLDDLVREYTVSITPIYNVPQMQNIPVIYDVYEKQNELDVQLSKGSFIGYKNVFEYFYPNTPAGSTAYKSKTKYTYDSAIDHPSIVDDSYPYFPIVSNEHMQSNIRKIEYFDAANNPMVTEDFKYNYDTLDIKQPVKQNFFFVGNEAYYAGVAQQVRILYTSYDRLVSNTISAGQYAINCIGSPSAIGSAFNDMDKTLFREALSSSYTFIWDYRYKVQLAEHSRKEYFPSGEITSKQTYSYRNDSKVLFSTASLLPTGDTTQTQYFYAPDPEIDNEEFKAQLIGRNMVALPLRTVSLKNSEVLSVQQTKYGSVAATGPIKTNQIASFALPLPLQNMLVPREVFSRKGSNEEDMEKNLTYLKYDIQGNVLEVQQENGMNVCYIWGHNKTVPVAKIENMNYDYLDAGLVTSIENTTNATPYSEGDVISALNALRLALPTSMVTGYVYKPQRGITATIDPRGYKNTYHYDTFGRLQYVKDHQGHILSHNQYNYRP